MTALPWPRPETIVSSLEIQCPHCQRKLRMGAKHAGKKIACPKCKKPIDLPDADEMASSLGEFDNLFETSEKVKNEVLENLPDDPLEFAETNFDNIDQIVAQQKEAEQKAEEDRKRAEIEKAQAAQRAEELARQEAEAKRGPTLAEQRRRLKEHREQQRARQSQNPNVRSSDETEEGKEKPALELQPADVDLLGDVDNLNLEIKHKSTTLPDEPFELELDEDDDENERVEEQQQEEDELLKIEGLNSELVDVDELYGISCHVCDTRIHVTPDKVGKDVECPICFTQVTVEKGPRELDSKPEWMSPSHYKREKAKDEEEKEYLEYDDDAPLKLKPVEPETIKPPAQVSTPQKDVPLDELIEDAQEELLEEEPVAELEPQPERPEPDYNQLEALHQQMDDGFGLPEISEDLLAPLPDDDAPPLYHERQPSRHAEDSDDAYQLQDSDDDDGSPPTSRRDRYRQRVYEQPVPSDGDYEIDDEDDFVFTEQYEVKHLFARVFQMLKSPGMMWRLASATGLVALGSICYQICHFYFSADERSVAEMLIMIATGAVYVVAYLVGIAAVWYLAAVAFRASAEGKNQIEIWQPASWGEFQSTFLLFAFGFFIAGVILDPFIGVAVSIPLRFLLAPLLLLPAWFNRSPYQVFSLFAFKNFSRDRDNWLHLYGFLLLIAFIALMFGLLYKVPFSPVAIIPAIVQSILTVGFATVVGWHSGRVVALLDQFDPIEDSQIEA